MLKLPLNAGIKKILLYNVSRIYKYIVMIPPSHLHGNKQNNFESCSVVTWDEMLLSSCGLE